MKNKQSRGGAAQAVLDADEALRIAADKYGEDENDDSLTELRQAALAFARAWDACGGGR